ncbi:beta-lactamase [Citromicrobium sp. WPS32]|nr:beta-lactamase [Citromicrobium sp. WPS32]|tara:strand:- start:8 stop:1153 length:1146 start_codon:yes stop_codon:yes gene_type:complete
MLARIRTACLTLGAALSIALAVSAPTPTLAQTAGTLQQSIASCDRGDQAACLAAGLALSDVENRAYDPFLALRFLQQACAANQTAACGRLALIFFAGEGDVERDLPSAGNFATRACAGNDRDGCEVAEAVFAEPGSPQFDAEKALRYRRANCTFGNRRSCIDLARILYAMDDALPAEQIALAACVPGDPASAQVCAFGQRLQSLRRKAEAAREAAIQAARNAQAREQAVFEQYMGRRDYDGALYYSLYHLRSKSHAETAIMAAARAGALSTIFRDHFYVLEYWFPSGPVAQIAASQIAASQIAQANDCGIWNCTNTPGASSARWRAAGGSSGSSYSRSSGSSFQPVRTPSSAEIARQTRDKYRSYNCTGSRRLSSSHPACQ